ncbi:DNA-processing protein DprA [Streptomyces cavernicola]|uniref:DNA-processing protein DprA n=1 Tax=Streptomyces cavernicola TaxID=3043613 RepID=A0ABT6SEF8_9ACTN|nr:DNA-processing protein DprA [Streptomyces sp. B-S-A6]MDI3406072.1 DNA-processing protein DprA [Streptomyces sp. B-S-A6]
MPTTHPPPTPDPHHGPDDERRARITLTRILEPGDDNTGRWLRTYGATRLLHHLTHEDTPLPGITPQRLAGLRNRATTTHPETDLHTAHTTGARFLIPTDPEWPSQLRDLGDAQPVGLWVRGNADLRIWALRSVALVGARACTEYGAHMAAKLAAGLAEHGWVVVSGGAYGIDGAAHRATLAAGGATAAILANGVDTAYPRGHTGLLQRIAEQGLLIAELPPGAHPTAYRFIQRNRIIAALTRGTLVIEAAHRSGALVTARNAARLGRHTMGVPGPATSSQSAGVHQLLRGEATLVTDAAEVIELIGEMGQLAPEQRGPVIPRDLLKPLATRVLAALPAGRPTPAATIATDAATTPDDTIASLYELQSLGFVERHGDNWKLTRQTTRSDFPRREDKREDT